MRALLQYVLTLSLSLACEAKPWPYNRYHGMPSNSGRYLPDLTRPEFGRDPTNGFGDWLHNVVEQDETGKLKGIFLNGSVPDKPSLQDLLDNVDVDGHASNNDALGLVHVKALFSHLNYSIDPECTSDASKWWFRTYDGSCNWLKAGESSEGQYGTPRSRDYDQHYYADGVDKPREGPNPRAVSNAFFRRKKTLFYEHTPFMLGLVEFIMHDVTYSKDSTTEFIEVPMPEDEDYFYKNTTLRVWRTEKAAGTGTSQKNPRENANMATTWLDVSSLYGSTEEVAKKLRSFQGGKLLTQEIQAPGTKASASYLPFNTMDVPTRTRPGVKIENLFAGGDPRTNEDWIMLAVHTLLLREHNRLCGILAKQHPEYDDETLYQTVRVIMSAKFALIGNAYQMAYWTDSMPWPRDDGFPLYREMYGEDFLGINPANTYPWPIVTKNGKPMTVSAEMAVVYRFHEFIIESMPIKNALNDTLWDQKLFETGFNATGFLNTGLENILRGAASTYIPNFKSGVDESFRSAGKYRGAPFDIVTWSIVHEREQGLPTFNNYFRAYNKQDPKVVVPIRNKFEDFSSNPEYVASLKKLYKTVDDVDLVVGVQLDEEMFPHTTIPKSALIISLFSLFGMGNSDRFSIGYAAMRCMLVDKPWDCHPSNALENLLWKPMPKAGFPHFRFYDPFWMAELDFQAHGTNLLWRLVTENTEIKCLQKNPLFPVDEVKNPILCSLPPQKVDYTVLGVTSVEVSLSTIKSHKAEIISGLAALVFLVLGLRGSKSRDYPPAMKGWPVVGKALDFQNDAKKLLLEGFAEYGSSESKVFGMKLAALTHYVLTRPEDLRMMLDDNPYEIKFSAGKFFEAISVPTILRVKGYDSSRIDVINLIHTILGDNDLVAKLAVTMQAAGERYLNKNPLVPTNARSQKHATLGDYLNGYITSICARAMVGADADDHPEFVPLLQQFNEDTDKVMGMGQMLPSFLQFIPKLFIGKTFNKFRKILLPIIKRRRANPFEGQGGYLDFMPFVLEVIDDDNRASDLITLSIWFGLRNLQATLSSTLYDINNVPGLSSKIVDSLNGATIDNLNVFGVNTTTNTPWALLRSAVFESIRLCGTAIGPARVITNPKPLPLASDPDVKLPPKQAATLSPYYTHRQTINYGTDAAEYRADRFIKQDPDIGATSFIAWGLRGPHLCPGRWFAQEALCVLAKQLLERYEFKPVRLMSEDEKYIYHAGVVTRKEVEVVVSRRE